MTEAQEQIQPVGIQLSMRDVGSRLADARARAELSVEDVAGKLCLRTQHIEALESGTVDDLPGQTFVRGFIRNYAKLLQLDAEPLIEAYRRHAPEYAPGHISLHSENITIREPERRSWLLYAKIAVVIGMGLGAWMVYMDNFSGQSNEVRVNGIPANTDAAVGAVVQPLQLPVPEDAVEPVAVPIPEPAASAAAGSESRPVAEPPVPMSPAAAKLDLTASQQSWVRVLDRDGKELLLKTIPGGSTETIAGMPPLRVEIGNSAGMQVSYNGQAVDLGPHTRANVARLTLE